MPIFNDDDGISNIDLITPERKLHNDPILKTSTLFNKDRELDSIIQYVEGSKWTVDYFQQIREINTPAIMPDPNVPVSVVSYNRINKLIINLDGAINQDDVNNITGTAAINAGFLPNYGDPFIATLTGGREAVFVVTLVEKKLYSLHDMYTVEFKLHAFLDKDSVIYKDLLIKTMKEYMYDTSYIMDKSAPIILAKDYKDKLDNKKTRIDVIDYYFRNFVNKEKNIITFPTIDTSRLLYLDPLLNEFIFKTMGYTGYVNCDKITRFDIKSTPDYTVYDAILNRDIDMLATVNRNIGFRRLPNSITDPTMRHIGWLGIDYVASAVTEDELVDYAADIAINKLTKPTTYVAPILARDNNYIFSEAFYNKDIPNCGLLEKLLLQYLRNEVLDSTSLNILLDQYLYWDMIDQYYLLPILVLLIQDVVNNTFSQI